jgi:C1A family cysteine protease
MALQHQEVRLASAAQSLHRRSRNTVTRYERVSGLAALRAAIHSKLPVVFGFQVYESFESDTVAATGAAQMPQPHERCLGGHAVLAVGYDDTAQHIICRNSWGSAWGQQGYFTLPYGYVTNTKLSDDYWAITQCEFQ